MPARGARPRRLVVAALRAVRSLPAVLVTSLLLVPVLLVPVLLVSVLVADAGPFTGAGGPVAEGSPSAARPSGATAPSPSAPSPSGATAPGPSAPRPSGATAPNPSGATAPGPSGATAPGPSGATTAACSFLRPAYLRSHSAAVVARNIVADLSLSEELGLLGLWSGWGGYENTNLGAGCVPRLTLSDGSQGVSYDTPQMTQLPAPIGLGATFSPSLAGEYGADLGIEAEADGLDVLQAPDLNLVRVPGSGRAFESLGEDPILAGDLGTAEVAGIVSEGTIAEPKHLGVYTQETDRPYLDQIVSARTLQEVYLPPFEQALSVPGALAVMCAYGEIDGTPSCEDPPLYEDLASWGFSGIVRSDQYAVAPAATAAAYEAGLDLLKPAQPGLLTEAVQDGKLPRRVLDQAAERVLEVMDDAGLLDRPRRRDLHVLTSARLGASLLRLTEDSMVLLKDADGILPLGRRSGQIAVIGPDGGSNPVSSGLGSAYVEGTPSSPAKALSEALRRQVSYEPAVPATPVATVFSPTSPGSVTGDPPQPAGSPVQDPATATAPQGGPDWSLATAAFTAPASGTYVLDMTSSGDAFLDVAGAAAGQAAPTGPAPTGPAPTGSAPTGSAPTCTAAAGSGAAGSGAAAAASPGPVPLLADAGAEERWTESGSIDLTAGETCDLSLDWDSSLYAEPTVTLQDASPAIDEAVAAARRASTAVVFAAAPESEGMDRQTLALPGVEDELIEAVAAANPRTVVVLNSGGAVLMPWLGKVEAVLEAWYPGVDDGTGTAAVLDGRADPAGRLPVTFPTSDAASATASPATFPGEDGTVVIDGQGQNGLDIGYRWYEAHGVAPLFPFGYGLSYTHFALSRLAVHRRGGSIVATVRVRDTGGRAGTEVVQAYLSFPRSAGEPPEELKAFAALSLRPRRAATAVLSLPASAFEVYSPSSGRFVTLPGTYELRVGTSSGSLPLSRRIEVAAASGPSGSGSGAGPTGPSGSAASPTGASGSAASPTGPTPVPSAPAMGPSRASS
ncbi:MAG TPA: glycoside hydrolase family 3 C-terminal domain-containing protein [Acidimicrobiales bacterium]|nr:glycoside hydrolase family 3 C-terminal domain-containing protein [Acidimicrobiales bacterium]